MRDDEGKIQLDSVVVAVTLGLVTSGMLLQAGIISGLPLKTIVLAPLLIIGIWNSCAYRLRLVPTVSSVNIANLIGYGFLFFLYSGATVIASCTPSAPVGQFKVIV